MSLMKKNFDEWFQVDYDKNTLSLLVSEPKAQNLPVLVVFSDCSCQVFIEGLQYAKDFLSPHKWATIFSYEESDDYDYILSLASLKNTKAKKKAKEYGELPMISDRVVQELNAKPNLKNNTQLVDYYLRTPPRSLEKNLATETLNISTSPAMLSPTSAQKTRMMLKEQRDRGSHMLKVYIAKPPPTLNSSHQFIFFDFFNDSRNQSYWTFKPDDFSAIFSELRKNEDIDDIHIVRNVYHYPRSDPANTYNQLVFKGGRQIKNNTAPAASKKDTSNREYDIRQYVFGFSISYSASTTDVERTVKGIVSFICSPLMQELYHEHKERSSQSFRDEIVPGGPMWKALNASLSAIQFKPIEHLDEVITFYHSITLCSEYLAVESSDIDHWTDPTAKSFASKMYASSA